MDSNTDSNVKHRLLVVSRLIPIACQLNNEDENNKKWEFTSRRNYNAMYSGINSLKTESTISQIVYFGLPGDVTIKGNPLYKENNSKKNSDDYMPTNKANNIIEWENFTP